MAKNIGPIIAASARLGLAYAKRLLDGIPDEKFAAYARNTSGMIESNHPAFVCGHLSIYAPIIMAELGQDASSIAVPESYDALFSHTATCQDDLERKIYPPSSELISKLINGYTLATETFDNTEDDVLLVENPNERMRGKFPTMGAMHAFYVGGHFMMHMGQLSAWRRAIGLGPA